MPTLAELKAQVAAHEAAHPEEAVVPTLTKPQAATAQPNLLPPGYRRDEQLAQRADTLAQQAEEKEASGNIHAVNPAMFDPQQNADNEILQHYDIDPFTGTDRIHIANLDEEHFAYKLVNYAGPSNGPGQMVWQERAKGWDTIPTHTPSGQPILDGNNLPRNVEFNSPYIGDTILMRMPIERFKRYELFRKQHIQERWAASRNTSMRDDPHGYVKTHTDMANDPMLQRLYGAQQPIQAVPVPTVAGNQVRQPAVPLTPEQETALAAAQGLAFNSLTDDMRTGTIAGKEAPRG